MTPLPVPRLASPGENRPSRLTVGDVAAVLAYSRKASPKDCDAGIPEDHCWKGLQDETAKAFTLGLLVRLVKHEHGKNPAACSMYVDADHEPPTVMVLDGPDWRPWTLEKATRALFDGVAAELRRVTCDEEFSQLSEGDRVALLVALFAYDCNPADYVFRGQVAVRLHLASMRP